MSTLKDTTLDIFQVKHARDHLGGWDIYKSYEEINNANFPEP